MTIKEVKAIVDKEVRSGLATKADKGTVKKPSSSLEGLQLALASTASSNINALKAAVGDLQGVWLEGANEISSRISAIEKARLIEKATRRAQQSATPRPAASEVNSKRAKEALRESGVPVPGPVKPPAPSSRRSGPGYK